MRIRVREDKQMARRRYTQMNRIHKRLSTGLESVKKYKIMHVIYIQKNYNIPLI